MTSDPQGIERRKFFRVKRNFVVRVYQKGLSQTKYEVSQIENVSKGGMCFSSSILFKQGDILEIELRTPYISDVVHLEGIVLQCQDKVRGVIYHVRVQFQNLTKNSQDMLEKIEKYNSKGSER